MKNNFENVTFDDIQTTNFSFDEKSNIKEEFSTNFNNRISFDHINEIEYSTIFSSENEVFSSIYEKVDTFSYNKEITVRLINSLKYALNEYLGENSDIVLNKIIGYETEDKSHLIEWNFENVRIGFAIENNINDSNYYIIFNKSADEFFMEAKKIDFTRIDNLAKKVIQIVVGSR